jgi:hypothetical protein
MKANVRIDGEVVGTEEFVRLLKGTGQFESLIEEFVRDRLTDEDGRIATTHTWQEAR